MKTQRIVEILKSDAVDTDVVVKGWVRTKRGNKNVAFIALNDGSCVGNIQVVVDLAKISEEQLKYEGYQVDKAADGRTGLDMAQTGDYDLILLDIMLPALNGMEVLRRLRRQPHDSHHHERQSI